MMCPVCASEEVRSVEGGKRGFFRCGYCGFSWVDPRRHPDEAACRRRYGLHSNDIDNDGYIAFLSRIIDRGLSYAGTPRNAIDWGSGPEPIGVELLRWRGIETFGWDPLFSPRTPPPKAAFDLALCIETAEHFTAPRRDFRRLAETLKPGGWGIVHTHIAPSSDADFLKWWYIQDITHLSFYSEEALRILGELGGLEVVVIEENLTVYRRPLPVLVAGGINLDIEGRPNQEPIPRDSNPGSVRFSPGGCGRNIAENLSRLGVATELVGVVGNDVFGDGLRASALDAGVGVSGILTDPQNSTAAYLSMLDHTGDMISAVSGMALFDEFTPSHAETAVNRASASAAERSFVASEDAPFSALLLDGNLLPETAEYIRRRFPAVPCWFDTVSVTKTRRAAEYQNGFLLRGLAGIKLNALEAAFLLGPEHEPKSPEELVRQARERLSGIVYLTAGPEGAFRGDPDGTAAFRGPSAEPVSATGAGDAFLAAAFRRRLLGMTAPDADLIAGAAAAYLTLQSPHAVSPDLNSETLASLILQWRFQKK